MTINEFEQMDLRVGKVVAAEKVPNSEKLLKLRVDLGDEERQIVAGVGKTYEPDKLVGREIVVVANMEPRILLGEESRGMLLAAHGEDGVPIILTVEREVPPGSKIT